MKRPSRALVPALLLSLALPALPAGALTYTWEWAGGRFTTVSDDRRVFAYHAPDAATAQQPAHELSARRNRNDDSDGRARAAVKADVDPVNVDSVRVRYFGRPAETGLTPSARLRIWVHCVGELADIWVRVGQTDVAAVTNPADLVADVTVEDCESQRVNGLMLQVLAGKDGQVRKRTVYLTRAELRQGGAAVWTEDFTAP